jgi:hypothetical protein
VASAISLVIHTVFYTDGAMREVLCRFQGNDPSHQRQSPHLQAVTNILTERFCLPQCGKYGSGVIAYFFYYSWRHSGAFSPSHLSLLISDTFQVVEVE